MNNSFNFSLLLFYVDMSNDWGFKYRTKATLDYLILAMRKYGQHSRSTQPNSTMSDKQPQSHDIFFDPQKHPDNTLKSFTQFTQTFQFQSFARFGAPTMENHENHNLSS